MALLLALAAAVAYGTSDFVAGLLSRRASFLLVGAVAQFIAMTSTLVALLAATAVVLIVTG
ncbi:MAG: hypothetical protein M3O55_11335 [Actinomycetota bacterium]|nr:hypothetical protein [Actinomycetota bacterium]